MKENKETFWTKYKLWIIGVISLVFILVILRYNYTFLDGRTNEAKGTFGDMYGISNALFSALAFLGVIITIMLQKDELEEQRNELKETRKEFQIQNKTLKIQRFENTFFQLLGIHHSIVENMEKVFIKYVYKNSPSFRTYDIIEFKNFLKEKEKSGMINNAIEALQDMKFHEVNILKGRYVFKKHFEIELFPKLIKQIDLYDIDEQLIDQLYKEIYENVGTNFGHYYRNLYRIFKYIDKTEFYSLVDIRSELKDFTENYDEDTLYQLLNNVKRYEYTSMIRSQLSDIELQWLFFNCLSTYGKKFNKYVQKYTLLKNHPGDNLREEFLKQYIYNKSAFNKFTKEDMVKLENDIIYNFDVFNEIEKKSKENELSKDEMGILKYGELIKLFIN